MENINKLIESDQLEKALELINKEILNPKTLGLIGITIYCLLKLEYILLNTLILCQWTIICIPKR